MSGWVLITRPAAEIVDLAALLARNGLCAIPFPALAEHGYDDEAGWDEVRAVQGTVGYLVVTSPRAPRRLASAAAARGLWDTFSRLPVAAVGAASAAACRAVGLTVRLEGAEGGASLGASLAARLGRGAVVVHAAGRDHREEMGRVLSAAGVSVVTVVVYAMREATSEELPALPGDPPVAVVATSPRAARVYARACGSAFGARPHFVLGPTTAAELERLGYAPGVLRQGDLDSIVEELCQTYS